MTSASLWSDWHYEDGQQQHPFSEEVWSLPVNGGTKFLQNRAVRGRRNGVATLLELGEQYALAIPEHRQHDFPGRWCHLKLLVRWGRGMFPLHGGTLRLGLIVVHPRLFTCEDPRKHVVPFVLVALEMLQSQAHSLACVLWCKLAWHPAGAHFVEA